MRTDLALLNILSNPAKTILSIFGIGVAISLVFMQLGFRGAVEDTATSIYKKLDFDLLIRSPNYLHFVDAGQIDRGFAEEVAGIEGVQSVKFLRVSIVNWRNPSGQIKAILLFGVDPNSSPFLAGKVDEMFSGLTSDNALLIDRLSNPEFGPLNETQFDAADFGRKFEVSDSQMTIVGLYSMGAGLSANGSAIVSDKAFLKLVRTSSEQDVSLAFVKLQSPKDAKALAGAIRPRFQRSNEDKSVEILDRDEVIRLEIQRWVSETPVGFIFTVGAAIALLVGAAIIYMVLGNDVANRLNEYATLRAMGYSNIYLATVILKQALYLALFSFLPALLASYVFYWMTAMAAKISMEMNVWRIVGVLVATLVMCSISGAFALKKLWKAEPADLF